VAVRGIAAGAGTVLSGFLVLDQRGHGGGGEMRYYRSSHSEVKKRGYIQWGRKWMKEGKRLSEGSEEYTG
jgi:hypothetical protein